MIHYFPIKDLVTFTLTGIGLYIAGSGLSTWKRQIRGVKEFEISYNLNYSVLKLRDAVKHVRSPAIWNSEFDKAKKYAKEKYPGTPDTELDKYSNAHVYEMRWEEITKADTEMESHLLGAEVLWGPEILNKIKGLKTKVTKLNISLKQYLQPEFRTSGHKELHDIVFDKSDENGEDLFSEEVNQAVGEITSYIKEKYPEVH